MNYHPCGSDQRWFSHEAWISTTEFPVNFEKQLQIKTHHAIERFNRLPNFTFCLVVVSVREAITCNGQKIPFFVILVPKMFCKFVFSNSKFWRRKSYILTPMTKVRGNDEEILRIFEVATEDSAVRSFVFWWQRANHHRNHGELPPTAVK